MAKNLFLQLCEELNIPHTSNYTNRQFDEHPYKYTLWGVHRLLEEYGMESEGIRFFDKKVALLNLSTPFVAQVSDDLVLVKSIADNRVSYQWYDELVSVSYEQFIGVWSGIALLLSVADNASEPHYHEHRHAEWIRTLKIYGAILCTIVAVGIAVIQRISSFTIFNFWLLVFNVGGFYVSYLLLLRQLNVSSIVTDKLCNLYKRTTCVDILNSSAAKVVYGISWSEMGAAYFCVNIIVILLLPDCIPVLGLFSATTLGYVIWSLWFQHFRAHTWCPLCLLVQCVFVFQAIIYSIVYYNCLGGEEILTIHGFLIVSFSYLATILILHNLLAIISKARQTEYWRSGLCNFKLRREVFDSILQQQNHYEVDSTSGIRFGNPDASYRLTILTNPYCNPCAAMHARISDIKLSDCCIEMFFASFGQKYDRICRLLIAAYLQLGVECAWQLYAQWYDGGKLKGEVFFEELCLDDTMDAVTEEYQRHIEWCKQTGFSVTPTILVNGYRMPQIYNVDEFKTLLYA